MKKSKELLVDVENYFKKTGRTKITFKAYCENNNIQKTTERATLKKLIMSSSLVGFSYTMINGVSEMLITLP